MEWNKVKNIMIVMLLITNIFLLILTISLSPNDAEAINKLLEIMKYREVEILCEIPQLQPLYLYANIESKEIEIEKILPNLLKHDGRLEEGLNFINFEVEDDWELEDGEDKERIILDVFKNMGFDTEGFYLDRYIKDEDNQYFFTQKIENIDFFNNKIIVIVNDNMIKEFRYQQKVVRGKVESNRNQELFNASQILLKNIINKGDQVVDIRYGIMESNNKETVRKQTEELFVWRIVFSDNRVKYYSVLDGNEIKE